MQPFLIGLLAMCGEFIDSGLGMMYGTLLAPLLILWGFSPKDVVPAILLSQACGGIVASFRHHNLKNASFSLTGIGVKTAFAIGLTSVLPMFLGSYIGINVPKSWLQIYIGCVVFLMGGIVLLKKNFFFSWKKVAAISVLSSFNKAISGGGYGPVVSTGLIMSGLNSKLAIATTDLSEIPICLMGFAMWITFGDFHNYQLLIPLCIGSVIGGAFGPLALAEVKDHHRVRKIVGGMAVVLGLACTLNLLKP